MLKITTHIMPKKQLASHYTSTEPIDVELLIFLGMPQRLSSRAHRCASATARDCRPRSGGANSVIEGRQLVMVQQSSLLAEPAASA
jgi:hypothetical protein